jgi:hypothetical protein
MSVTSEAFDYSVIQPTLSLSAPVFVPAGQTLNVSAPVFIPTEPENPFVNSQPAKAFYPASAICEDSEEFDQALSQALTKK